MTLLTTSEEISNVAFGFMGSKALFAALHNGLFTHLAVGPMTAEEMGLACGLHPERTRTLLTALCATGLISSENGRFANGAGANAFLVKGAKHDFGDYLRLQVDRQMYPLFEQIEDALANRLPDGATGSYADWFADADEAKLYSESQHAGSLGPARSLVRMADLSNARRLLDVGGGTGAMAITLCEAHPKLTATIVDFPNVADIGRAHVAAAGLSDRIEYIDGDALATKWPADQDAVLMSYLFSGVPGSTHESLISSAYDHLSSGGRFMLHDFVVNADRSGPKLAALWQLQHTAFTPEARSLDDARLECAFDAAGFSNVSVKPMIPGMTMLAQGVRPGQ